MTNLGFVNFPTHLTDDRQGGMVVLAVVDGTKVSIREDPWGRAELIEPNHYGIAPGETLDSLVACVPLGTSDGCWWHGRFGAGACADPYRPWECTLEDLTDDGRALVAMLVKLYGRSVRLVTHIDT